MSSFGFYGRMIGWNIFAIASSVAIVTWIGFPFGLAAVVAGLGSMGISLLGSRITQWEIDRKTEKN